MTNTAAFSQVKEAATSSRLIKFAGCNVPRLEFFVVAESVSVDQRTNRLSLFNILEEMHGIHVPEDVTFPRNVIPQLVAASSWLIDQDEIGRRFHVQLRLHQPDQIVLDLGSMEFLAERR